MNAMCPRRLTAALSYITKWARGTWEPLYRNAMCVELVARGIPFECEKVFSVKYREKTVGVHRLDLSRSRRIVIELKAVKTLEPMHDAQLLLI